jgi:hypothetical protein
MSIWIDRKYLLLLSPKLELFKRKSDNLYNFRCPYCNDSQKIKTKTRGYVYSSKNNYFFTCHNCSKNTTLRSLIDLLDPFLAKEYSLENFQENSFHIPIKSTESLYKDLQKINSNTIVKKCVLDLPTIKSLSKTHIAKEYLLNRKIPESKFDDLYYAEDFRAFVSSVSDKILPSTSARIVIPFISKNGTLKAIQGRAIDKNDPMRYITIKINEASDKLYGVDKIDISKPIFVLEGSFDSMFLQNSIATSDSNLSAAQQLYSKDKLILVSDNEPRNLAIVNNIEKFINAGFTVCLFPRFIKGKDINEMILNGLTSEELTDIIMTNSFIGLRAKLEFLHWRKL